MHKLIKYGKHGELNTTRIFPSARESHRVPFGTGRAISELCESESGQYYTYAPESFYDLQVLIEKLPLVYVGDEVLSDLPAPLFAYLRTIDGAHNVEMIRDNTTDWSSFEKRFWQWFDAFQLMKYLHFVRDGWYEDIPVREVASKVYNQERSVRDMLVAMRSEFAQ